MSKFNDKTHATADRRAQAIARQYNAGRTMEDIAKELGITRQRVQQIMKASGMKLRKRSSRPDIDVSEREYERLAAEGVVRAYGAHRSRAIGMGIAWEFTLSSWWKMWRTSKKWELRGKRGKGKGYYVMARFEDRGPYSPQNCRICPMSHNVIEAQVREMMLRRGIIEEVVDADGHGNYPDRKFRRLVKWP